MKLTAQLALGQIKTNRSRSAMTLLGIVLSVAMLTAVCGFVQSAKETIYTALGIDSGAGYHVALLAMGAVLGAIIITASVIVVSNAFRVSAAERTRQFGILKSVGATKKQIAATVLYEGLLLSVVGIPIGIGVGLLVELLGTSVITWLMHSMASSGMINVDSDALLNAPFIATPAMFAIAVGTSLGTVLLSAWLPARKAARIPAIDAIRSAGEVTLQRKAVRTSRLIQALFGFEGTLAAKSLKRSRRSFRATVISLTISIVMLIAAGSLSSLAQRSTSVVFPNVNATAVADWSSSLIRERGQDGQGAITNVRYLPLDTEGVEAITDKLRAYDHAEIYGVGGLRAYTATLPDGSTTNASLYTVDAMHYEELCKAAGVPVGSNILINLRHRNADGKRTGIAPYDFAQFKDMPLTFTLPGHEPIELTVAGELTAQNIPEELAYVSGHVLEVLVPTGEATAYSWFANVEDVAGFTEYARQVLQDLAPKQVDDIGVYTSSMDIIGVTRQMRNLVNTIMFFVYGFIGMLTLIAVTSVISTIGTNIRSRAREFAVLESVGMTKAGIRKMLNLESVLCSARSLVFGIPLGLASAFALYQAMRISVELPFSFPWLAVAECVLGVFVVTWMTMRYAAGKLGDGSIIETIRGE